jgi:hypothetical protein
MEAAEVLQLQQVMRLWEAWNAGGRGPAVSSQHHDFKAQGSLIGPVDERGLLQEVNA